MLIRFLILSTLLLLSQKAIASEAGEFGQFSVSLGVKNFKASRAFYEKLGFSKVTGEPEKEWIILKKGDVVIGLFTESKNGPTCLTFNPKDVRAVQKQLKQKGFHFDKEVDEKGKGPGWAILLDPDHNKIMFDQH